MSSVKVRSITPDWNEIITFAERKIVHSKGTIDAERLCTETVAFLGSLQQQGYYPSYVFVDNAEQVILNSIRVAVRNAGFPTQVAECRKVDGKTRILTYNMMLNRHKMKFQAVPMVVEMIYQNILLTAKRNGTYDKLMQGINTSRNFMLSGYDARREIFSDIHEKLGGKLECIFCGGAYLSPEIEEFMYDIGIQIRTGYGLTECSPIVTCARRYEYKFGSVGLPLECCEIMIHEPDEDGVGEIYVKGDNVMAGYYGDPEATAAAFDGDWLKTGDYGKIDEEGYLWFSGRKKNLIILSNGKNVSPEIIEGKLVSAIHYVKEALVFEKDNHICAELYLDEEEGPEEKAHLAEDVEAVNVSLADFMRISSFTVRDTEFPKTATLKIKRGEAQAARQATSV